MDLVESTDKILLEVTLDLVTDSYHIVGYMVDLALVKLILDEVGQLLIVILRRRVVTRAAPFFEGTVELGLVTENLLAPLVRRAHDLR